MVFSMPLNLNTLSDRFPAAHRFCLDKLGAENLSTGGLPDQLPLSIDNARKNRKKYHGGENFMTFMAGRAGLGVVKTLSPPGCVVILLCQTVFVSR